MIWHGMLGLLTGHHRRKCSQRNFSGHRHCGSDSDIVRKYSSRQFLLSSKINYRYGCHLTGISEGIWLYECLFGNNNFTAVISASHSNTVDSFTFHDLMCPFSYYICIQSHWRPRNRVLWISAWIACTVASFLKLPSVSCSRADWMRIYHACLGGAVGSVAVRAAWLQWSASLGSRPRLARSFRQVIATYALRLNSRPGTEGSTVSSLICDRWLILGLETLNISRCLNHW